MRRALAIIATALALAVLSVSAATAAESPFAGLVIGEPVVTVAGGQAAVAVDMLCRGKKAAISTRGFDPGKVALVTAALKKGNLVDFVLDGETIAVPDDPSKTFHLIFSKGDGKATQFDSMKYGPELAPFGGKAGAMTAAGWVYAKTASTITVGDGRIVTEDVAGRPLPKPQKRYEETYAVAKDAAVYAVDTSDYGKSSVSDLASVPVTADYAYTTKSRQAVYVVFDRDYSGASAAKASAIYYFTPQSEADGLPVWDVQTRSSLLSGRGNDPASGKPYVAINATGVMEAPYTRSTEPFEIVKDSFYYVGDNEVAIYLFKADLGTKDRGDDRLIMLDAGWPNSGYQYWKNIEACGADPRAVTDIMLTHGHGDHYGTAMELVTMIESAGGHVTVWGTAEDTWGITRDALGNPWSIPGALPEGESGIRSRTVAYEYDREMDFGNVRILVTPTPGHTPGTGSFVFKVKNPASGAWLSFGYMGGYGFNGLYTPTPANGYLRLAFQLGLAWLQQMVEVDYVAPQHTNQYPIVDVYQALKAYNNDPANARKQLTMLDAMTKGEFANFLEKRYSVVTNMASDLNDSRYKSLETSGPFKPGREYGASNVKATLLDGGKIIRGFNGTMNVVPAIPLLKNGVENNTDVYTHDPDSWYVQFYIDVLDSYKGFIPGQGPVESMRPTPGAPEVLRTQRLGSRDEAEAILRTVRKGGTYIISLTAASAIFVPRDVTKTFKPAEAEAPAALAVREFPKIGDMYGMLDPKDPYKTVVSGLFRQSVKVGDKARDFLVYIAKDNAQYQPYLAIVPDAAGDPIETFVRGGWKDIVDASGMIAVIPASPDGRWDRDRDMPYLDAMYAVSHIRNWYNAQKGNNYLVGYGDGAALAQAWAMKAPANFCSFAAFGDFAWDAAYAAKAGSSPSELKYVPLKDVPMPVWLYSSAMTKSLQSALDYWKYANKAQAEMLSSPDATGSFQAKRNGIDTLIDEQDYLAETRFTLVRDPAALNPERARAAWSFLSSVIRPVALANGDLRAARSTAEWGAVRKTIVVDGVTRYWIEFVPKQLRPTADGKAPLVVYMHGNNNTAEAIVDRTEMIKCANERGFIVVFPTGSLYNSPDQMPNPRWNLSEKADEWNDYKFIRAMVEDVAKRLPVDKSRMYLSGQSYGSMATLAMALRMNDVFAAGASTAAFLINEDFNLYKSPLTLSGNRMPIYLIIGERDNAFNLDPKVIVPNFEYWISRNGAGSYDSPAGSYKDGRFNVKVWSNSAGVPLVQYAIVDEKPHTPLPMDNFIMYDTFLSKFSRGADGTLYYQGKEVK